jgi:predicted nucleic acid-binding protein
VIVLCDSAVLIGLAKTGRLDLLQKVFSKIYIPEQVFKEVVERAEGKPGARFINEAEWIETRTIEDKKQISLLMGSLDKGEAEVLALAKDVEADLILLDEKRARQSAIIAGFKVMGVLGLLILAKNLGLLQEVRPLIEELQRKKFRISDRNIDEALIKAGE